MLRVVAFLGLALLLACGDDDGVGGSSGSSGSDDGGNATGCPAQMPEDNTPCGEPGLLCFYDEVSGELVRECLACNDWPCGRVSECGREFFNHIDVTSCLDGSI